MKAGPPDPAVLADWLKAGQVAINASDKDGADSITGQPSSCEFDMHIAPDGTWFYHGSPIGRNSLVQLFARVLFRDQAGDYWLVTPAEHGRISVEDAPFTAVELAVDGAGPEQALHLRTNLDDWVTLDAEHPLRITHHPSTGEPRPYILVRGRLEALITRSVFYELVELGGERAFDGGTGYGVWSKGVFFPLDDATGIG